MASFFPDFSDVNSLTNLDGSTNYSNTNGSGGFNGDPIPSADGNGLPSSKVNYLRSGVPNRDIIHWFVPEFGVVKMFVNPTSIVRNHKKLINKDRTKGGYALQYWGEELDALTISGTTGSSGIEGINLLYEIYRAEQLAFDSIGLSLAANNAAIGASNQIISGIGNAVGSSIGSALSGSVGSAVGGLLGQGIAQGIFGTDNFTSLAPRNIPSLAQFAFGVEMFYSGIIYRGFFENMNITENSLCNFEYTINFTATQTRGYRTNTMPWQRSAVNGPSNSDLSGGVPPSFKNLK